MWIGAGLYRVGVGVMVLAIFFAAGARAVAQAGHGDQEQLMVRPPMMVGDEVAVAPGGEKAGVWQRVLHMERGWVLGDTVVKGKTLVPLTGPERIDSYFRQTLTTPGPYLQHMFLAGFDQARGVPSQWDGGFKGYAERFASREGQFIASNTLTAAGNAALRYEPRYEQCQCTGFWPRTQHAILRNFMTYNRTERQMRPQWALYGGAFGGGVIAGTWQPHPRNVWARGGWAVVGQAGFGVALNFAREFVGEINRKLGAR